MTPEDIKAIHAKLDQIISKLEVLSAKPTSRLANGKPRQVTEKQHNFIRDLLSQKDMSFSEALKGAGLPDLFGPAELTSKQAHDLIDWLLSQPDVKQDPLTDDLPF